MRAVVIGLASQPMVASLFDSSTIARCSAASFLPRASKTGLRPASIWRLTASVSRQRGFAVAGDVEIDILEAAEILIIRFQIKIADTKRDDLGDWLGERARPANNSVAEGGYRSP
jgi:hypothetical protein